MPASDPRAKEEKEQIHAARRLCELFKGRFSEDVARKLIEDLGGELQAVDFVLNEKAEVVSEYLKENPDYVDQIRADGEKISSLLENGIEYEVRQFACPDCVSSWWKKVPARKQVSKCKKCHVKYDPVPQNKEWGWAKFVCVCSQEFHAYGETSVTLSPCYKCGESVPVDKVLPPRRRIGTRKKSNKPHSCNGVNCFSQDDDYFVGQAMGSMSLSHHHHHHSNDDMAYYAGSDDTQFQTGRYDGGRRNDQGSASGADGGCDAYGGGSVSGGDGGYPARQPAAPNVTPVCIHPKSSHSRSKIRTPSQKHISTGSTVGTFLSQGSIDTASVSVAFSLGRIDEVN